MAEKLTPFDLVVTDEKLQTLKLLLPYVPSEYQSFLGIYVKFAEFQNTVSYFRQFPGRHFWKKNGRIHHIRLKRILSGKKF